MTRFSLFVICAGLLAAGTSQAAEPKADEPIEVMVGEGQHVVLPTNGKVKRVAIGNSDTADVTVLKNSAPPKKGSKQKIIRVK